MAEKLPTYMSSRTLLKDLRAHLPPSAALFPPAVPTPPTWSDADQMVVRRWKDYVEWERSNPCELKGEEEGEWKRRVEYALKKAVGGEGRFYPELWFVHPLLAAHFFSSVENDSLTLCFLLVAGTWPRTGRSRRRGWMTPPGSSSRVCRPTRTGAHSLVYPPLVLPLLTIVAPL